METKDILLIVLPILTALCSYIIAIKTKKNEVMQKFREEKYSNLLILLQGFVGNTANYETKKIFFEEQYKSWIYSSDEVIIAINTMVQLVKDSQGKNPDRELGKKAIGNIVLAMRRDLLGKTNLSYEDFTYTDVHK
jgi:hypothetical protein